MWKTLVLGAFIGSVLVCINMAEVIPDVVYNDTGSTSIPNHLAEDVRFLLVTGTGIVVLHMEQFEPYQDMERLQLLNTPVERIIPDILSKTPALKTIIFNGCPLTEPPNLGELKAQLQNLEISDCGQSDIPQDYFDDLVKLTSLTLMNNRINEVKSAWFAKMSKLTSLVLSINPIYVIPELQLWLPKLKRLNINYIEAESIPESLLIGLPNLKTFGVEGNKLTSIPDRALFEPIIEKNKLNFQENPLVCDQKLCWLKVRCIDLFFT